jgi:P27 family predicted phage terminase small subunit
LRGRPRKPAQLRLLEGHKGHSPIVFGPKFSDGFGSCPKFLEGEAKKLWRQLSKELEAKGLSAKVFRPMLEGLCYWYGEWRRLIAEVKINDTFFCEKSGYEGPRPQVTMSQKAFQNYRLACQEFGLTPASNGKVTVPKSKKQSLKEKLTGS